MKVTLLCNWSVRGTVHQKGSTVDLSHEMAQNLLSRGYAVPVEEKPEEPAPKTKGKAKK